MNKEFRMWKSGKHWLFAGSVILTLGLGMSQPSIFVAQANGTVAQNKASVSRTSDGFTATNVSEDVKSVKVSWITDTSKIKVNVNNAFYIKAPFSFDVELNKPLAKGESVTVPLRIDGQIFNSNSESSVRKASQNNGNYYVSQDKNYSYDYDQNKQEVTITALTDAGFTTFENMSYFLNNDWVPVPLRETPYPLSGGVEGNYGAKGSGGTIIVSIGDNTTSESVTNTEDIAFSEDIVKYNHSIIESNSQDITTLSTAASSNNFLGATSEIIAQSNKGRTIDLLDGSMDHYSIKPLTNSKANETGETDPYSLIRTELYMPIGSSSTTNNIRVIAGGFTVDKLPALKNVFKNAKYNKDTGILEFDLSRNASDWGKVADEMLTAPEYSNYLKTEWIKTYLQSMSGSNPNHNTLYVNLYEVSPQAYSPINYNLPLKTDIVVKNSKSNQTRTQYITVNPVSAGKELGTQAGITALYVDEKTGEPIGKSSETKFFDPATGYTFNAPGIPGYKYVSKNDSELISKLGVTDVVDEIGKVTTNMVGKQSYILYSYTKVVPVTYSVIDSTDNVDKITDADFATGIMGETFANDTNKEKLDNIVKDWESKGYKLEFIDNGQLPDVTDEDGYNIEIHLTHNTSTKTVPGVDAVNKIDNRKITQTINYTGLKDKTKLPQNNVQTWEFESKVTQTIDNVTGKVIAETDADWNLKGKTIDNIDSIAFDTPLFKGYTPDIKQVKSKNINSNTENSNITVTYKANPAKVKFVYRDVDNSSSELSSILKEDELDGNWDENWDYSDEAKRAIKDFEDKGYQLLNKDDVTGTYSDEENTYYITFKHRLKEIPNSETKDITKTISYKNDKGEQISPNNIQVFHFSNTTTLDMVTGEKVQDNWGELQKEEDVKSPDITGYTPYKVEGDVNENSTPELIKGNDVSSNSEDNNITVIYSANISQLNIHFIDVNDLKEDSFDKGQEIKESEINISGKYNENWDAMSEITKEIENLKSKGYIVVKQDDGISQGIFGAEDTNLNIYLKHNTEFIKGGKLINGKKDTKYNKEVTQTIEYKGVDNILNDTQSFTFADNVEYDLVTGEVVSVKDDDSEFKTDEVVSAKVQGYTVDKEKVESNTITRNDDNSTIIVTYKEKPKETVVKPDKPTEPNKEVPNKEVQDKTPDVKRKPDIKTGIQNIKKNPTSLIILTGLLLASIIGFFKVKKK